MLRLSLLVIASILAQQSFADEPERIVGGQEAAPGEFPYQCSLQEYGYHFCGCSILSETQILTAAHCVIDMSAPYSNMVVVTGSTNVNQGQKHAVKSIHCHPKYVNSARQSWVNDIAIITLKAPMQFNNRQKPVALANTRPVSGQQCTLSGWGMIRANGPLPTNLLKMTTNVYPKPSCQASHRLEIFPSHVCALTREGIGACQGDSGGPLVCNGRQVGITSWVLPCARGVPDVYTDVWYHLDFIETMKMYA